MKLVAASLPAALACALQILIPSPSQPRFAKAVITQSKAGKNDPEAQRWRPDGRFVAVNVTTRALIAFAYQRHPFDRREVVGGPPWIDTDRYDVDAVAPEDHEVDADGTPRRSLLMLQTLLTMMFQLAVHEEKRERPAYMLTTVSSDGTLGPRLRRSTAECRDVLKADWPARSAGPEPSCWFETPPGRLFARTFSMPMIASLLARHLDRPVVDATGLEGLFDVALEASDIKPPPDYKPGPGSRSLPPGTGPSIVVAVRDQLGLALEPQAAGIDVIVVDAVNRRPGKRQGGSK